jgi:hypothetical protein
MPVVDYTIIKVVVIVSGQFIEDFFVPTTGNYNCEFVLLIQPGEPPISENERMFDLLVGICRDREGLARSFRRILAFDAVYPRKSLH